MKKTVLLILIVAVLAIGLLPTAAALAAPASAGGANLCLINPVAVSFVGGKLFVADNVDEANDSGVILCFTFDGAGNPVQSFSYTTSTVKNLAAVGNQLCVVYQNSFALMNVEENSLQEAQRVENVSAADVTYGHHLSGDTTYFLGTNQRNETRLFYFNRSNSEYIQIDAYEAKNPVCCLTFENQIYFLHNGVCKRYNGTYLDTSDTFNAAGSGLFVSGFTSPEGLVVFDDGAEQRIAVYNNDSIYALATSSGSFVFGTSVLTEYAAGIVDVDFGNGKLFVLNALNQVEIFEYQANGFAATGQKIGTDTITLDVEQPTNFDGFTLAYSTGYPTNIVYRTEFDNSVEEIVTDYFGQYIILHFDGADELDYYYVLKGDKFGWVAKSSGSTTPQQDEHIAIVDNNVSNQVQYNAKFISANAVHIYQLPLSSAQYTTFNQSVDNPQDVVVLQRFVESMANGTTNEWYFVEYGDGQRGFILSANIGRFYPSSSLDTDGMPVEGYKKINASLFEAVKLFATAELLPSEIVHNQEGQEVKLYSGTHVVVVQQQGTASFVEIRRDDGTTTYGWIDSSYLIGTHDITTNAVVGISILSVAIALAIVLLVFFRLRKKQRKTQEEEF